MRNQKLNRDLQLHRGPWANPALRRGKLHTEDRVWAARGDAGIVLTRRLSQEHSEVLGPRSQAG